MRSFCLLGTLGGLILAGLAASPAGAGEEPWERGLFLAEPAAVLKALEETHNAGFRYPIVTDLRHRPALPPFLEIPKEA